MLQSEVKLLNNNNKLMECIETLDVLDVSQKFNENNYLLDFCLGFVSFSSVI